MINNLKALVVVMGIAIIVFTLARPVCLRFMAEADFVRRRNIWFALTITAFMSPSFWLFAGVALPLLAWGARKDSNPLALCMLVYSVIPLTIERQIPIAGINALFPITYLRIVSFAILIPVAWQLWHSREHKLTGKFTKVELFVLAYAALHLALIIPYESVTQIMRRGFLYFLDVIVLYFVAIRACTTRKAIIEVMAAFCLLCAIMATTAVFESQRHWLLYADMASSWNEWHTLTYASRDGGLRAQVTAGQSIPLGYVLAFGFGIWLYLSTHVKSRPWIIAFGGLMWAGMIAAHARAPWVMAVAIFFAFNILGPNGMARFWRASFVTALLAGLVLVSPIGGRVIDNLPFIGTVGANNVEYRQQIATVSFELIKLNPFFGDPLVLKHLEVLRQGEGIIDIVNMYANIAMFYGLTGLFFFIGPFIIGLWTAFRLSRRSARLDPDLSLLSAALTACMFGFLLAMGMGGTGPAPMTFAIVVIGLSLACSRLGQQKEAPGVETSVNPRVQPKWKMKRG